jgi:glycosyltransferase involved in cell wall biosynthesis
MKILLVAEKYPPIVGGGETHVHQLADGLAGRGHQVSVLTEEVGRSAQWATYRDGSVEVIEMTGLMAACQRLDCKDAVQRLHAEFAATDADIVHVFNYVPALLASWLRPSISAKLVVSLFETFVPGVRVFDLWSDYALERALQRGLVENLRPDLHLCGSRAYLRWSREAGFREPAEIVEFGTDLHAFTADRGLRERWRADRGLTDEFLFVVPARPVPRKRIEDAIAALADVATSHRRARLVLTAPTDRSAAAYVDQLRKLAADRGVTSLVRWEHGLGWHDMPALYNGADAMILPSSHEGWGISLTEAMACRIPVITTNVEGHDEVVEHERTGLLYQSRDVRGLAAHMRRVMDSDPKEMVERALNAARGRFSIEAVVRGHESAYRALLESSPGATASSER